MKDKLLKLLLLWNGIGIVVTLILSIPVGNFHHFIHELIMCLTFTNCIAIAGIGVYLADCNWFTPLIHNRYGHGFVLAVSIVLVLVVSGLFSIRIGNVICGYDEFVVDRWHLLIIIINLLLLTSVTIAVILYFLHQRVTQRLALNIEENEQLKRLQLESKLSLLQSKINPHFLFNTLNTMLDIVKRDSNEVERIILNLSDIYRKTLASPDKALIPVSEELELVRKYLEIEQVRMGERLRYTIDTPEQLQTFQIPPMIIQVLVENAVKHGISSKKEGGAICIDVNETTESVIITVTDDGVGIDASKQSTGHGLYNIQQRIKLHYGGRATMSINTPGTGGTSVRIELPFNNQSS